MTRSVHAVFVTPDVIFPELKGTLAELREILALVPVSDVLIFAGQINCIVATTGDTRHVPRQQLALTMFVTPDQINKVNEFALSHGGIENIHVFFRAQMLEVIRWSLLFSPEERPDKLTIEADEVKQAFVKACFVAGKVWSDRVYERRLGQDSGAATGSRQFLAQPSVRNSIDQTARSPSLPRAATRALALHLHQMANVYPEFSSIFQAATGLDLQKYIECWVLIANQFLPEKLIESEGASGLSKNSWWHQDRICQDIPHAQEWFDGLVKLESQTIPELRAALWPGGELKAEPENHAYSLLPLRQKPILSIDGNFHCLLDPRFCVEKLSVGPLFHTSQRRNLLRSRREPFESFGKAFEGYTSSIFDKMFNAGASILSKRFEPNVMMPEGKNTVEALDGLSIGPACAAFIQTKARFLREDNIIADDPYIFSDHILEKYADGLDQLVTAIKKASSGEWKFDLEVGNVWKTIYPILLVHDGLFDAPVQQETLIKEFEQRLQGEKITDSCYFQSGRFIVTPLVLLTIEMLEDLESSLRLFSFTELLQDYCLDRGAGIKSLQEFVHLGNYGKKLYGSRTMTETAITAYDSVISNIFRENPDDEGQTGV